MPDRGKFGKRRDRGLRINTIVANATAVSRQQTWGTNFCAISVVFLICIFLTVWGDIVDMLAYRHKVKVDAILQSIDDSSGPLRGGDHKLNILERKLPQLLQTVEDDSAGLIVQNKISTHNTVVNGTTNHSDSQHRGSGTYCVCKSDCYAATDGAWCYLETSACKIMQPCARLSQNSDFCISFGPGGPATRCINIHEPEHVGLRKPVDHFNLPAVDASAMPRAKSVARGCGFTRTCNRTKSFP